MTNSFRINLRPNEKIYVNGAVLRFDRRTSVEFLNDVSFLLEAHVMQPEDAISLMQQLYYIVQIMLMAPGNDACNMPVYARHIELLRTANPEVVAEVSLNEVDRLVSVGKFYEAMKFIRKIDHSVLLRPEDRRKAGEGKSAPESVKAA